MKERPILFNDAMVRAILDGRKTQTRRVAKLNHAGRVQLPGSPRNWHLDDLDAVLACPFGQPGDRLWVRECFSAMGNAERHAYPIFYRADNLYGYDKNHWTPSIHMPRWASRITLEITGVRVERLQDISERDAREEGVEAIPAFKGFRNYKSGSACICFACARDSFYSLWESINGAESWAANPWVWVVEFRRLP